MTECWCDFCNQTCPNYYIAESVMTGKAPPNLLANKIDEGNVQDFQEVANDIEKGKGEDDP